METWITVELNKNDIAASQPFVAKPIKKENIRSIVKKKFKVPTDSLHKYSVAENKLLQNFTVTESNKVWASNLF